jgi:glycosyltransferase involved in cell wall biosynthesis
MTKISVIMATCNGEKTISRAIDSILNQSYTNIELIIVDDASTDDTKIIISRYKTKKIKYLLNKSNLGLAKSLNIGLAHSSGCFIARMDDDDFSHPDRFTQQIKFIKKGSYDLVGSAIAVYENGIFISSKNKSSIDFLSRE